VFLRRDYSQQELRILAHEDWDEARGPGKFLQMYLADPTLDGHDAVQELVRDDTGVLYERKYIKNTNFGILYGMGAPRLAQRLGIERAEARRLKRAVLKAVPGINRVIQRLEDLAAEGLPFRTWGGREYYCEPPKWIDDGEGGKERRTFEYKMLNYKIQGSAADCTKVGMIQVHDRLEHGRIVLQVHDEILCSVPKQHARRQMGVMRGAMEDVDFRVPMLTEGEAGGVSWARLREVDW
jgi:DNA polymerase-1